jgi:lambda repressor-like predicted transcriptional regulator
MLEPHQIRARLLEQGILVNDVAREMRVKPVTVSSVITKKGKSKRIQRYIAGKIGESFEYVWGD